MDKLGPLKWATPCVICGGEVGWRGSEGAKCLCEMGEKHLVNTFLYLRRKHGKMRLDGYTIAGDELNFMFELRKEMEKRQVYRQGWVRVE